MPPSRPGVGAMCIIPPTDFSPKRVYFVDGTRLVNTVALFHVKHGWVVEWGWLG